MLKKLLSVALAGLLLNLACAAPVLAGGQQDKDAKRIARVKKEIATLGTGPRAKLEVKLRDKTKLRGYVSDIGEAQFAVTDEKSGAATTVAYAQVEKVMPDPSLKGVIIDVANNRTVKAVAVGIGIGMLAILVACFAGKCQD